MSQSRNKIISDLDQQILQTKKKLCQNYAHNVYESNINSSDLSYKPMKTQNLGYNDYVVIVRKDKDKQQENERQMKKVQEHIENLKYLNELIDRKNQDLQRNEMKLISDKELLQYKINQLLKYEISCIELNKKIQQLNQTLKERKQTILILKNHKEDLQNQLKLIKQQKNQLMNKVSEEIQLRLKAEESLKMTKHDLKLSLKYSEHLQSSLLKKQSMSSKDQRDFRVLKNLYLKEQKSQAQKSYQQKKPYYKMIENLSEIKKKLHLPQQPPEDQKHIELKRIIQELKKQIINLKQQNTLIGQKLQNYFKVKQVNSVQQNLISKLQYENKQKNKQINELRHRILQLQDGDEAILTKKYFTNESNSTREDFKQYFQIKYDMYEKSKNKNLMKNKHIGKIYSP